MKKILIASLVLIWVFIAGLVVFKLVSKEEMPKDIAVAETFYSVCCVDGNSNDCESFSDIRYTCIPGGECTDRGPGSSACPANRPVVVASGTTCTPENNSWGEWTECTANGDSCSRTRACVGQASCGGVDVCGGQPAQTEACAPSLCGLDLENQIVEEPEEFAASPVETNDASTSDSVSCPTGQTLDANDQTCKTVSGECGVCGNSDSVCGNGLTCNLNKCERTNGSSNCYAVQNFK